MLTLGFTLLGLGFLVFLIGVILMLVAAFRESIAWGLGSFFVPFVQYIFVAVHWTEAKSGFLTHGVGILMTVGGFFALSNAAESQLIMAQIAEASGGKFAFAADGERAGTAEA